MSTMNKKVSDEDAHNVFIEELREELDYITEDSWEKIFIRFDCVNNFSEINIYPSSPTGEMFQVRRSDKIIEMFFNLRKQDYERSGSAWYTTIIEIDKVKEEVSHLYNYEDEPLWKLPEMPAEQKEYILNREYSAELDNFPRDDTPTPGWLINRAMNWNPVNENPEETQYNGMPNFDEPPAHEGHGHPKADVVINSLIGLCLNVQPPRDVYGDWKKMRVRARAVGGLFEWDISSYDVNGFPIPVPFEEVGQSFDEVLKLLRLATYSKQTGAWFSAEVTLESESQAINIHFDYDSEPEWAFPRNSEGKLPDTFYEAYGTELEHFPRPEDRIPAWLQKHL
jgi:hypothetical protein